MASLPAVAWAARSGSLRVEIGKERWLSSCLLVVGFGTASFGSGRAPILVQPSVMAGPASALEHAGNEDIDDEVEFEFMEAEADVDGDGFITFDEFNEWVVGLEGDPGVPLPEPFAEADTSSDGVVTYSEFALLMKDLLQ